MFEALFEAILGVFRRQEGCFAFHSLRLNGTGLFLEMRYLPPKGVAKASSRIITVHYRTVTIPLMHRTHVHLRVLCIVNPRIVLYGYAYFL